MRLLALLRELLRSENALTELRRLDELKTVTKPSWFVTWEALERADARERCTVHLFAGPAWNPAAERDLALAVRAVIDLLNATSENVDWDTAQRGTEERLFSVPFVRAEIGVWASHDIDML